MSVWGKLASRFEGKENEKHRILALDGGGIRSILTIEILVRLEKMLAEATGGGEKFRLCHFFDYVGGTSSGAIIAAGLARGMRVKELRDFFLQTSPAMFDRQFILKRWNALYKGDPLKKHLKETFGVNTTLMPDDLECLFLAVTRSYFMDSPWPISSNPQAKYNDTSRPDCNLKIPLWQIINASTAPPVFFPPEVVQWDPHDESKAFGIGDGALTPYNNPAFLLYRMATETGYCLNWASGEKKLLIVSVGTGNVAVLPEDVDNPYQRLSGNIETFKYAAMVDQDTNCRSIGRCVYGTELDREIGDMIPVDAFGNMIPLSQDLGRKFLYARYNADLGYGGLHALGLSDIRLKNVLKLDSIAYIEDLLRIGRKVAEEIKLEHFGNFV